MQTIQLDISPDNCEFGSAPVEFWQHADFSRAWRDGQKYDAELLSKTGEYKVTGRGDLEYIHVPCHAKKRGKCAVCDEWDWPTTAHRLWPKWWPKKTYCGPKKAAPPHKINGREVLAVRIDETTPGKWKWTLELQ